MEWRNVSTEPFTENQIEWLALNGVDLPLPPRHIFWGEM